MVFPQTLMASDEISIFSFSIFQFLLLIEIGWALRVICVAYFPSSNED